MASETLGTSPAGWVKAPVVGGAAWLAWAAAVRPEWTVVLLLLSPFVLLPLGLTVASRPETGPHTPALHTLAWVAPAAAATAAASCLPDPGLVAALLAIPWLVFTVSVAVIGVGRLLSRPTLLDPGVGVDAGLLFVAIGGAWLMISRAGMNPLGFSDAIVRLTAVHFHYAGFALPIVAGFAAGRLRHSPLVPIAVIIAVPFTALGIIVGGWLDWFAASAMALAGLATAVLVIALGLRQIGLARAVAMVAGAALGVGMGLALGWAWSARFGWHFFDLEAMAAIHGSLNAVGFGIVGLAGLNMLAPAAAIGAPPMVNVHMGRPTARTLAGFVEAARAQEPTNPVGLLGKPLPKGFRHRTWQRDAEHADFARASEAMGTWAGHRFARFRLSPERPLIAAGETLALAIPIGPISVSATCRIVEVVDERDRYGFVYSTLPHHPEDGEESFIVSRHPDGRVEVTVTAVWRASTVANFVFPPLTRHLQNRAINQYLVGVTTT